MRRGFTLVELSIVLVILGLLVGGILAGKSLIRASELRAVTTEINHYSVAIRAFRSKYHGLPGDLTNASSFWPTLANGNGDGVIGPSAFNGHAIYRVEHYRAWKNLALAGFIEGEYTGASGAGHVYENSIPGVNIPSARINNGGWCFGMIDPTHKFALNYENTLTLGSSGDASGSNYCGDPVLLTPEAWNIDTKMDDGMPGRGRVIAAISGHCTTAGTDHYAYDATYRLDSAYAVDLRCSLNFQRFF